MEGVPIISGLEIEEMIDNKTKKRYTITYKEQIKDRAEPGKEY